MEKVGAAINYTIGALLMIYLFYGFKKKYVENPQLKIFGLKGKNILTIAAVGIAIFVLLTVSVLVGWIQN